MDKLKELWAKVLAWWNRFTTKQKTIIIIISTAVVFTFVIIFYVFSQPKYVRLLDCETTADAAKVIDVLEKNQIGYQTSADGLKIDVLADKQSVASIALGAEGLVSKSYDPKEVLSGGLTTTSSDKEKLWGTYLESKLASDLEDLNNVKSATVTLHVPEKKGTLLQERQESSAWIQLETDGVFTSANATTIAKSVATALGNETTANITIMDQNANLLFAGGDDYSSAGIANSMLELQKQAQSMVANQVKNVLYRTNQFDNIEVTSHLNMDFANYEKTVSEYYANPGRDEGMISSEREYESENSSSVGGVPGTPSNDGTVMVNPDSGNNSSSQSEKEINRLPNQSIEKTISPAGSIKLDSSSISIAMIQYREIREEDAKLQGYLDGTSWKEYKLANDKDIKMEVDEDYYAMVSNASGIPVDNITIMAFESPVFIDKEKLNLDWNSILSIILFVVILGLLAFVVLRSMKQKDAVIDEEEELSVESLLQSNPESELEDIDLETKSETRKMIEKFVDENPEAAAALLRNWLNADWNYWRKSYGTWWKRR